MTINLWGLWYFDAFHLEHIEEEEDEHMHLVSLKVFQETSWWQNEMIVAKEGEIHDFCLTVL